jgi:hypothetical protein
MPLDFKWEVTRVGFWDHSTDLHEVDKTSHSWLWSLHQRINPAILSQIVKRWSSCRKDTRDSILVHIIAIIHDGVNIFFPHFKSLNSVEVETHTSQPWPQPALHDMWFLTLLLKDKTPLTMLQVVSESTPWWVRTSLYPFWGLRPIIRPCLISKTWLMTGLILSCGPGWRKSLEWSVRWDKNQALYDLRVQAKIWQRWKY